MLDLTDLISNHDNFLQPLIRSLFLQPLSTSNVPDIGVINSSSLNKGVQYFHKLREGLRERFQFLDIIVCNFTFYIITSCVP